MTKRMDCHGNKLPRNDKQLLFKILTLPTEFKDRKKTEIFVSETKNSRAVVYESETVHEAREFEVATKIFLFVYYRANL